MTVSFTTFHYSTDRATRTLFVTEDAMRDWWHAMHRARREGREAEAKLANVVLWQLHDVRRELVGRAK